MRNLTKLITFIIISLTLMGCQTASMEIEEKGLKPLNDNELISLLSNKTAYGIAHTGRSWFEFISTDGTNYYKASGANTLVGNWDVSENQICYSYPTLRSGKPFCYKYYLDKGIVKALQTVGPDKGKWADKIIEIKEGDVEDLS